MDVAWVPADSEQKQGLLLSSASDDALQHGVGRGSSKRTRCGNRGLQRELLPGAFDPIRNRKPSLDRAASRGGWDLTTSVKPCQHSQDSTKHRERGTRTVRLFSRVLRIWNSHDTTVACFTDLNHVENMSRRKAGRHMMIFW